MHLAKLILILPLVFTFAAESAQSAGLRAGKEVLAIANGKEIKAGDITKRMWAEHGIETLNAIIIEQILLDKAKALKIELSENETEDAYKKEFGLKQRSELLKELKQIGWTEKDLKNRLRKQLLIKKTIIKLGDIKISDSLVQEAYENSKEKLISPKIYNISQINVGTQKEAEDILDSLIKNKDSNFAAVSAQRSIDPRLREKSGLLGNISKGQLPAELETEIFALRPGQLSKIIQIGSGFSIFMVNYILPSRQYELKEVKEDIQKALLAAKLNEKKGEIINALIKEAKIIIK